MQRPLLKIGAVSALLLILTCSALYSANVTPLQLGGTGASLTASAGSIPYSTSSALGMSSVGTSGYFLRSGGTGAPTWLNLLGTNNTWSTTQTYSALTASRLLATDGSKQLTNTITSANLAASVSDETGSGEVVFASAPTMTNPTIAGVAVYFNLPPNRLLTLNGSSWSDTAISSANMAASVTDETGTGAAVFANSPALVTPTINGVTTLPTTVIVKSADETVTSSTSLQDDNHLTLSIAANETWSFDLTLFQTGATSGDLKLALAIPSGAAITWGYVGWLTSGVAPATAAFNAGGDANVAALGSFGASTFDIVQIYGVCANSTNAGSLTLRWAQNSSDGTATTIRARSFLRAQKVS